MSEPSKTPWKLNADFQILDADDFEIGDFERIDDSKHVVTAVNSHAALLAACKALLHDATTPKVKGSEVDSFARIRNVEMACEAIAVAEGKAVAEK